MNMNTSIDRAGIVAGALALAGVTLMMTSTAAAAPPPPQGPCDIYAKAGDPCSGQAAFNGDLVADVSWTNASGKQSERMAEKARNVFPIKINEFSSHTTQPFIELYNGGSRDVDLSHWTVTEHPAQQAIFSSVEIPVDRKSTRLNSS